MDRREALTKLRKRFGKQFAWQYNPKAPPKEVREEALVRQREFAALKKAAAESMQARRDEVLKNDAEYQRLRGIWNEANEAETENSGKCYSHKFTVGTANSLFFHVEAQGDSWEDIFAKLAKKDAKVAA